VDLRGGKLKLFSRGMTIDYEASKLTAEEKKSIATDIARFTMQEDCGVAAFYLLLTGNEQKARIYLNRAGRFAAEARKDLGLAE
jgi:hypothetical protein